MCVLWNEERVLGGTLQVFSDGLVGHALRLQVAGKAFALLIEQIGKPLQEKHAEDVFLVLRRIHVPAQVVTRAEQQIR